MPKGKYIPLTIDQERIIKEKYLDVPVKTLADEIGTTYGVIMRRLKKWGLEIPKEVIERRKRDSRFRKGQKAHNKGKKQTDYMCKEAIERTKNTRFKKGFEPHNTKYNGHERISKDGYVEVRMSKGNYKLKHRVEWEKRNGPIPKGMILVSKDGNKTNTDPGNWKPMTRQEAMLYNSRHKFPKEVVPTMHLINNLKKAINNEQ
ncbi:HNH endonuclease signature motif containing protein [Zobellia galactanivorans]|uniref:HNH endonuclease signature motif containing protein n=1 Tax=Zobellia galactanivorans (strain DSM 12802 / CCUG 47099 / CIP 106680 / NCIMB 13871 / Dsij) TaxID=63186 RepID=UPI0026E20753|nr:HNH endonuclease signature motif containing protein [Zobellia galactanivorans]MDO6808103.1 HNH endonuclease signature motif containing protein [Zobellia galactanivorans]